MDTVYNKEGFQLIFFTPYSNPNQIIANNFVSDINEFFNTDIITVVITENEDVSVLFNSKDENARLYLEALDGVVLSEKLFEDEEGNLYRKPDSEEFVLYSNGEDATFALRVGYFKIIVYCNEIFYYGLLQVRPKQLSTDEWEELKNDLESELTGLAQDLIRRNIGFGNNLIYNMPPEKLYKFFVIKKFSRLILNALMDIKDHPRSKIVNEYKSISQEYAKNIDSYTIKKHLEGKTPFGYYTVPNKAISYDLVENQLLKNVIDIYESELKEFIKIVSLTIHFYNADARVNLRKNIIKSELTDFLNEAEHCLKITKVIQLQPWYREIKNQNTRFTSHSFALDPRYGILYKFYRQLKQENFSIKLDSQYSYGWKVSSNLYEMWCFAKLYRALLEEYDLISQPISSFYNDQLIFAFLQSGTVISFQKDIMRLDLIYDRTLPRSRSQTDKYNNPFYIDRDGCGLRPDIVINIFNLETDMYLGSIALECKYRSIRSYWSGPFSAKEQIRSYTDLSRSRYFRDIPERFGTRPVLKVLVLSPDVVEATRDNDRIVFCPLRPKKEDQINHILDRIDQIISTEFEE